MKTGEELIRFILSTQGNHEADNISQARKLLVHIIRHKNKQLYQESKANVLGFIETMIDKSNAQMVAAKELQAKRLELWKEVQAKLIELNRGQETEL